MIKVVYFDDQSATDYLYIYNGGAKVQTSDKVKEKSGEIANKTSAGLFAKLSWLPFWGGEGATEIDTSLGHKSNSLIKTTLSNTVLTDFLDKIKEDMICKVCDDLFFLPCRFYRCFFIVTFYRRFFIVSLGE